MSDERLERMLDEALATGEIPADATVAERAEIEGLLSTRGQLAADEAAIRAEAQAALPIARARFERFLANAEQPVVQPMPQARARRPWFRVVAGTAVAAIVVVAAVVGLQSRGSGTESAYAAVLEPGDYVQVEGVADEVETGDGRRFVLKSEFGELPVAIQESTLVVGEGGDATRVAAGHGVVVSGIVGPDRQLQAATIAVSAGQRGIPSAGDFERPGSGATPVTGDVRWFSHSPGADRGFVAMLTANGKRVVAPVDGEGVADLLRLRFGGRDSVELAPGADHGPFSVRPRPDDGPPGRFCEPVFARPMLQRACGVVTGRDESGLTMATGNGNLTVEVGPQTQLVAGRGSGLDQRELDSLEAGIGHRVAVAGGPTASGTFRADIVLFGEMAGQSTGR